VLSGYKVAILDLNVIDETLSPTSAAIFLKRAFRGAEGSTSYVLKILKTREVTRSDILGVLSTGSWKHIDHNRRVLGRRFFGLPSVRLELLFTLLSKGRDSPSSSFTMDKEDFTISQDFLVISACWPPATPLAEDSVFVKIRIRS
jgi:hypothetical protein